MLWFVPCARSGFAFNDYDYDNTNSNVSSHLSLSKAAQALPARQNITSTFQGVSTSTGLERDLSEAKAS